MVFDYGVEDKVILFISCLINGEQGIVKYKKSVLLFIYIIVKNSGQLAT